MKLSLVAELQTPAGLRPLRASLRRALAAGELLAGELGGAGTRQPPEGVIGPGVTYAPRPGTRTPTP